LRLVKIDVLEFYVSSAVIDENTRAGQFLHNCDVERPDCFTPYLDFFMSFNFLLVMFVMLAYTRFLAIQVSLEGLILLSGQVQSTMSENTDVSNIATDTVNSAVDNVSKLPASSSAPSDRYVSAPRRLFNREKSVHHLLGGGQGERSQLPYNDSVLVSGATAIIFFSPMV
jgi:hypothetical protein